METLIVYASSHGTTEKVAKIIESKIGTTAKSINLKKNKKPDISQFKQIIIGGSIHAGTMQKKVKRFCNDNMVLLLEKRIGLFICCMDSTKEIQQIENAFPEILRNHAICKKSLGGEFLFDKMNALEKFIVKKVSGIDKTTSNIDYDKIEELANAIKNSH